MIFSRRKRVPANLEEALAQLKSELTPQQLGRVYATPLDRLSDIQRDLGASLRDDWELWQDNSLTQDLKRRGCRHPNDMSSYVLGAFWRQLHGLPIRAFNVHREEEFAAASGVGARVLV